jgi:hypothetical protein
LWNVGVRQDTITEDTKSPEYWIREILKGGGFGDYVTLRQIKPADVPAYVLAHPEEFQFLLNRTGAPDLGFKDFSRLFDKPVSEWDNVERAEMQPE